MTDDNEFRADNRRLRAAAIATVVSLAICPGIVAFIVTGWPGAALHAAILVVIAASGIASDILISRRAPPESDGKPRGPSCEPLDFPGTRYPASLDTMLLAAGVVTWALIGFAAIERLGVPGAGFALGFLFAILALIAARPGAPLGGNGKPEHWGERGFLDNARRIGLPIVLIWILLTAPLLIYCGWSGLGFVIANTLILACGFIPWCGFLPARGDGDAPRRVPRTGLWAAVAAVYCAPIPFSHALRDWSGISAYTALFAIGLAPAIAALIPPGKTE